MDNEALIAPVPGPRSLALAARLRRCESRGVTFLSEDFPIFWEAARGAHVIDVDGNRYLDLTSAFGVATVGHTNPAVGDAIRDQATRLVHGLGDVHPSELRVRFLERLAAIAPEGLERSYLCSSGSEAIDFALKTAYLRTRRPGIVAFEGSYHGLTSSALSVTGIARFRAPFEAFLANGGRVRFAPFGGDVATIERLLGNRDVGTVVVEPIQGRAGVVIPPPGWLRELRTLCDRNGVVLILDEIYTGFGRTATMFACEHEGVVPDLLCVGKAIANGVPLAGVIGRSETMDAWQTSTGEALHTSTYLGNPLACAAALANLDEIVRLGIVERARSLGVFLSERLEALRKHPAVRAVRGRGALWGVETPSAGVSFGIAKAALRAGVIVLPSGVEGNVITLAPPLTIERAQLERALELFEGAVAGAGVAV
ncbi:MAG: aspartate aminotransferase family protein [Candidatus Eremiobacteraeota bacterium]|nr:aspartate aminotransferase family protein [Candidatus Eremiobacteraeota bacterium]